MLRAASLRGTGAPLPQGLRMRFEQFFGADLSDVRLHTEREAQRASGAIGAKGFSIHHDVVLAGGIAPEQSSEQSRLLAHELAHVVQRRLPGSSETQSVSVASDDAERDARMAASAFASGGAAARLRPGPVPAVARQDDDPDHPVVPELPRSEPDVALAPLEDWTPIIDWWDPASFWTPPETTREQVAQRLYGDRSRFGGFDLVGDKHVRLRSFDGVSADVVSSMRTALDARLRVDVDRVVAILCERRIDGDDEWEMVNKTVWWSERGDLTDDRHRSYFDAYLDLLDTHRLTEPGIFSDSTRPASEWLLIEVEEKQSILYPLLARRSSRGPTARYVRTGREITGLERVRGSLLARAGWMGREVGTYTFRIGEDRFLIESERYTYGSITVDQMIVDEVSATRAEIALRNTATSRARVMIPGGDGHYYGYTIGHPRFWEADYVQPSGPRAARLDRFWWHYPGTIFVPGGGFQPDAAPGGAAERTQRTEILSRALAVGLESLRDLDFDVLALLTLDQRVSVIGQAVDAHTSADASLIARILYATPSTEFPVLEHRLSTGGVMTRLINMPGPEGAVAIIGRVFTVKALESMEVAGENLTGLEEFEVGFDADGHYHYAYPRPEAASSRLLSAAEGGSGGGVAIGRERAAPGETPGPINRTVLRLQPALFRQGGPGFAGFVKNVYRGIAETMVVDNGAPRGPFLPTQLVRVTTLGPNPQTRIVTALEAVGLLELPASDMLNRLISTHVQGGLWVMAGLGLARAFGPALAGNLAAGGGARALGVGLAEAAATEAGRAALVNTALIGGMELVDRHRDELRSTEAGRAFLEIYDTAMLVWVSRDVARLIRSGLIPRLVAAADRVAALPGALRQAVLPVRAEAEALRRAIARYATPAEAAEAATVGGLTASVGPETQPGFFAVLRVTRGEVMAERLLERLAGSVSRVPGERIFGRLESLIARSEAEAAAATARGAEGAEAAAAATRRAEAAASARLAVAQRASQLRADARELFLRTVDEVIATRPNSLAALTDLLTAAAQSRLPNVFMAEVRTLVGRSGVSDDALRILGQKIRQGPHVLDLPWLNRTSISDDALDFLGRDRRTPWDLYRRAAVPIPDADTIRHFRTAARGAGAEMVAAEEAAEIGINVRRQVRMGSSEIDFEVTVAGRRHGFEVKGWTRETWNDALEAAVQRLNRRGLTDAQQEAVRKIDTMIRQLQDAQAVTGRVPYLGFTDALPEHLQARLRRVLQANGLGATRFVPLREGAIREAAAGTIGESLGIARP